MNGELIGCEKLYCPLGKRRIGPTKGELGGKPKKENGNEGKWEGGNWGKERKEKIWPQGNELRPCLEKKFGGTLCQPKMPWGREIGEIEVCQLGGMECKEGPKKEGRGVKKGRNECVKMGSV